MRMLHMTRIAVTYHMLKEMFIRRPPSKERGDWRPMNQHRFGAPARSASEPCILSLMVTAEGGRDIPDETGNIFTREFADLRMFAGTLNRDGRRNAGIWTARSM
jgi:hypothetical protein